MEVGDYARTEYGIIGKITKIIDGELDEAYLNFKNMCVYSKNCLGNKGKIIKSSSNIIDLIEVGDYVNGYLVKGKTNDEVIVDYYWYSKELCDGHYLHWHKDYIKSIVTKEQFESMEYKVGEDK